MDESKMACVNAVFELVINEMRDRNQKLSRIAEVCKTIYLEKRMTEPSREVLGNALLCANIITRDELDNDPRPPWD